MIGFSMIGNRDSTEFASQCILVLRHPEDCKNFGRDQANRIRWLAQLELEFPLPLRTIALNTSCEIDLRVQDAFFESEGR
jgi:hypothetical protein